LTTPAKQTFSCPACGKRFAWQPRYDGRKVLCKCGATFIAQLGGTQLVDQPVRLTDEDQIKPAPASARASAPASARATLSAPVVQREDMPAEAGTPGRYFDPRFPTRRAPHEMATEEDDSSPWRDWWLPSILLVVGLGLRFSQVLIFAQGQAMRTHVAIGLLLCEVIIGGVALGAGALAAASMLSTTFGEVKSAILKFAAISAFTSACAYFAGSIDRDPYSLNGIVLAWHVVLLLYFVLLVYLFKLDLQEGLLTTVIVVALQFMLVFLISRSMSPEAARSLLYGW
jgi:hypothetical protein